MPNTIILRGDQYTRREDKSSEAITPGHLLDFAADDTLIKNATEGGRSRMFAVEADYIGNGVTTAYANGDRVPYADCSPGVILWASTWLQARMWRGALH